MNLFAKTAEFERLCRNLFKRSQVAIPAFDEQTGEMQGDTPRASLSGPTPKYTVHHSPEPAAAKTNPPAKPAPLNPGAHPDAEHVVRDTSSAPKQVAKAPGKAPPPAWLDRYMGKDKSQEAAILELEKQQVQNKAQLGSGPSVGNKTPAAPIKPAMPAKSQADLVKELHPEQADSPTQYIPQQYKGYNPFSTNKTKTPPPGK